MPLTMLDDRNYLDINSLISVQFDDSGSAKVQFATGGSVVLNPKAAEFLHSLLQTAEGTQEPAPTESEAADENFSLISRKKGWFMLVENGLPYIVAAINAKGSCSIRSFDGVTGTFRGKQYRSGHFRDCFPQLRSARELTVPYQPNLERDCRERLPEALLNHLREQFG